MCRYATQALGGLWLFAIDNQLVSGIVLTDIIICIIGFADVCNCFVEFIVIFIREEFMLKLEYNILLKQGIDDIN